MATKEEREDRKKRIDKTKDRDNLIADNGLDGKVIDVYDILARSNSPVIVNLRKLNQYGITDEMIANLYENLTSSVETRDSAMDTLKNVYINLVRYINKLPNGIVIDPKTGEKDEEKSAEKAERDGTEDNTYYANLIKDGKEFILQQIDQIRGNNIDTIFESLSIQNKEFVSKYFNDISSLLEKYDYQDYDLGDDLDTESDGSDGSDRNGNIGKKSIFDIHGDNFKEQILIYDIYISHEEENFPFTSEEIILLIKGYITSPNVELRRKYLESLRKLNPNLEETDTIGILKNSINEVKSKKELTEVDDVNESNIFDIIDGIDISKYTQKYLEKNPKKNEILEKLQECLIIEAKLEANNINGKHSIKYDSIKRDRDKFYKDNEKIRSIFYLIRDKDGNITEEAKDKILKLVDNEKESLSNNAVQRELKLEALKRGTVEYEKAKKNLDYYYESNPIITPLKEELRNEDGTLTDVGKQKLDAHKERLKEYLILLEARVENAKGKPEYGSLLNKRNEFCKANGFLDDFIDIIRDKDGNLTDTGKKLIESKEQQILNDEIKKVVEIYKGKNLEELDANIREKYCLYITLGATNGFSEELKKMCVSERNRYYSSDLKENSNENTQLNTFLAESNCVDIRKIRKNMLQKFLAKQEKKERVFIDSTQKEDSTLIKEDAKITDAEWDKTFKENSEDLLVDFTKSAMQRSFDDSRMLFTSDDETNVHNDYRDVTLGSWIDSREEALELQYAFLTLRRDEYLEKERTHMIDGKIQSLNKKIKEFEKRNPKEVKNYKDENGNILPELKKKAEEYNKSKMASRLLRYYSRGTIRNIERKEYDEMPLTKKRQYLHYTILGLIYGKDNNSVEKLALRRLEALNMDGDEFIKFDENGSPKINEERILKEYNEVNKIKEINSFEELKQYIFIHESDNYINKKLEEYERLNEEDFKKVDMSNTEKALKEIENIKLSFNRNKGQQQYTENTISSEKNIPDESDKHNSVSQKELVKNDSDAEIKEDSQIKAEENSLVPQDNSIFGRFKKAINELKNNARDALKKFKDLFAGKNPEEKNEEKNEINGQNPKKVQESAFDKYRVEGISGKIQEQSQSQTVTGEKQGQKNQEGKTEEYEDITM